MPRDDFDELMHHIRQHISRRYGRRAKWVSIGLDDGEQVRYLVAEPVGCGADPPQQSHSEDFRVVLWFGRRYTFTPSQASVIAVLWNAWESGLLDVGQADLLAAAGSDCTRLQDLFKRRGQMHPAWGVLIVVGERLGSYRLAGD
jgi:hypothetical protein